MRITALAENTSACGLPSEHGLSLYIEYKDKRILFDTGQSELFANNAERLGIDLSGVDICVLSHGHYDHGGGLRKFMELNKTARVYMSRYAFEPHYNADGKYIGLDPSLKDHADRIAFTDGVTPIGEGLTLYSCNDSERRFDMGSAGLYAELDGELVPDDFRHEHYLLIEEDGRKTLISGCSHKGVLNIAEWFRPNVLVGGLHFMKLECGDELGRYAGLLNDHETRYITCHCTGEEQYRFMRKYMDRLEYISTGQTVTI